MRERNLLTLEEAIYKMSGFPAQRFNIPNRGELALGKAADVVIFDPNTVAAQSTFEQPTRPPVGITHVIVNGQLVITNSKPTGVYPGQVLRHKP